MLSFSRLLAFASHCTSTAAPCSETSTREWVYICKTHSSLAKEKHKAQLLKTFDLLGCSTLALHLWQSSKSEFIWLRHKLDCSTEITSVADKALPWTAEMSTLKFVHAGGWGQFTYVNLSAICSQQRLPCPMSFVQHNTGFTLYHNYQMILTSINQWEKKTPKPQVTRKQPNQKVKKTLYIYNQNKSIKTLLKSL